MDVGNRTTETHVAAIHPADRTVVKVAWSARVPLTFGPSVMDIRGVIADQLGHFTLEDVPSLLLAALLAMLLGWFVPSALSPSSGPTERESAITAALVALAAALVRSSLPIALVLVAALLLVGRPPRDQDFRGWACRLAAVVIGVGCGSGAALITVLTMVPVGVVAALLLRPKRT